MSIISLYSFQVCPVWEEGVEGGGRRRGNELALSVCLSVCLPLSHYYLYISHTLYTAMNNEWLIKVPLLLFCLLNSVASLIHFYPLPCTADHVCKRGILCCKHNWPRDLKPHQSRHKRNCKEQQPALSRQENYRLQADDMAASIAHMDWYAPRKHRWHHIPRRAGYFEGKEKKEEKMISIK